MIKGTTTRGFAFEIPIEAIDDWDLIDMIESGERNALMTVKIAKKILGDDYKAFVDSCRDDTGRAPIKAVEDSITEILSAGPQAKNS